MAAVLYRGSSCRIRFRPVDGTNVEDLGDPSIAIYQDNFYLPLEDITVDTENNCIYADLDQTETLLITDGIETTCQAVYSKSDGTVYRFPVHNIEVRKTIMWTIETDEEEEETLGEEPNGEEE